MASKKITLQARLKGANKTKQGLKGIDSGIKSLGKSAMKMGAGFFAAQGIIAGFKAVVSAAGEQELAQKKLEFAAGSMTNALISQARALQNVTIHGDEAIIGQQAYLASLGLTQQQIEDTISASVDLAAATGMTLESAVMNTSKTLSGMAGELGEKLGPGFRNLSQEALKAGEGIKFIADQFGGTAQAETKTMTGQIEQMKNAVGDAAEVMGAALAPAIIIIANGIKLAAGLFTGFNDELGETLKISERMAARAWKQLSGQEQVDKINEVKSTLLSTYEEGSKGVGVFHSALKGLSGKIAEQGTITEDTQLVIDNMIRNGVLVRKEAETDAFSLYMEQQRQKVDQMKLEEESLAKLIEKYPELALQLGLIVNEEEKIKNAKIAKQKLVLQELKQAALVHGSAQDAMKAVVRAETMEAVAGYISSVLKTVPYPLNLILAAGGGAIVGGLVDKAIGSFATGGDFVTSGPQMMMVGDNPGGKERVQVTPIGSPNIEGPQGGITLNISAPLVDETVIDSIIPAIQKAQRLNLA